MASTVRYHRGPFQQTLRALHDRVTTEATVALQDLMSRIEEDTKAAIQWNTPGVYERSYGWAQQYHWRWTVTGMARDSITAYVVPQRRVHTEPHQWTISFLNRRPRRHKHWTDPDLPPVHSERPGTIIGIVTMSVGYAPYLQQWELRLGNWPTVIHQLDRFWEPLYRPLLARELRRRLG